MKSSSDNDEKTTGEVFLKGVKDALREYETSDSSFHKVELIIEDTKKDQGLTLEIINKFGTDKNVIALFGPIYSSELVNNAGAADFHKIPLISPTATLNDLAGKNPYVFQLNPTYDIRGKLMAKYAISELGMKNFMILSEDSYGKLYSESFMNEVHSNNCLVYSPEYYSKDTPLFQEHFATIRSKITAEDKFIDFGNTDKLTIEKLKKVKLLYSNIDSLTSNKLAVSIFKLFGINGNKIADSLNIVPVKISDSGKKIIPGIIDAIYIPVSSYVEIPLILSELESSGIIIPILGTSDWNNEEVLSENSGKIKTLYFESDFYLDEISRDFLTGVKEDEMKNYYFGYDGMKLILDEISTGNLSRDKLNDAFENLKNYDAKHNNMTMKERTNNSLSVMFFGNGKLIKLTDFTY